MDIDIYAIVVIYNKNCTDSITCRCLKSINDIRIIIVDNSTKNYSNGIYCAENSWTYLSMNGNKGLSKAYNHAIDTINNTNCMICLFDDDSEFDIRYFNELRKCAAVNREVKIFLPYVYDDIGLLSPGKMHGFIGKRVENISDVEMDSIAVINSGMAVRSDVFEHYHYDEHYFLDCVDHAFIRDMKKLNYKMIFFDAKIKQRYFISSEDNIDAILNRFSIYKKDFKLFCGKSLIGRKEYMIEILKQKRRIFKSNKKYWLKILFI